MAQLYRGLRALLRLCTKNSKGLHLCGMDFDDLVLLMMGELKAKGFQANVSEHRSGYHHSWFDTKDIDMKNLAIYPSDSEIQEAIDVAYKEATSLLSILGIENSTSGSIEDIAPQLADALAIMESSIAAEAEHNEDPHLKSKERDPTIIDQLLAADNIVDLIESRSNEVDQAMANLGIAATAVVIHDTLRMQVSCLDSC